MRHRSESSPQSTATALSIRSSGSLRRRATRKISAGSSSSSGNTIRSCLTRQGRADLWVQLDALLVGDLAESYLPDDFADAVISNCVINLCPDKEAVYREAFRILKPGGRLAISDVDYSEKPAHEVKSRFEATWAGCVGGAMEEQAYFDLILQAGFEEIRVVARHSLGPPELEEMASCPSPEFTPRPEKEDLVAVQGTVTSIKFTAAKPFPRQ